MEGEVSLCTLKSSYNYNKFINELTNKYGFEQIGEGGFGIILGVKSCVIKLIKDIKRCQELKGEIEVYNRIDLKWKDGLLGNIPKFNLYNELNDYCHFNMERIYGPLLEYDDGEKVKVGYLLDNNKFKFFNSKYGQKEVNINYLDNMPRRKLIHFYINHYDVNFKYKSDERGDIYGLNMLVETFTENQIKIFTFAVGQLISFLILDCDILPFDIEVVIGTTKNDKQSRIYMLDFNECLFITDNMSTLLIASEAARSLYNKDGKFYFPNRNNLYYPYFVDGLKDQRNSKQIDFIDTILQQYNNMF